MLSVYVACRFSRCLINDDDDDTFVNIPHATRETVRGGSNRVRYQTLIELIHFNCN